jgi:hypothetical protein
MNYDVNTITVGDLRRRLAELNDAGRNVPPPKEEPQDTREHIAWCEACDEFEELKQLETAMLYCDHCGDRGVLVNEDYWTQYCEIKCYNEGLVQADSVVAVFTDWEKVADRIRQGEAWQEVGPIDSQTFLVRS